MVSSELGSRSTTPADLIPRACKLAHVQACEPSTGDDVRAGNPRSLERGAEVGSDGGGGRRLGALVAAAGGGAVVHAHRVVDARVGPRRLASFRRPRTGRARARPSCFPCRCNGGRVDRPPTSTRRSIVGVMARSSCAIGSRRTSDASWCTVIHTESNASTIEPGRLPTGWVAMTCPSVVSTFVTVPSRWFVTHSVESTIAMPCGMRPTPTGSPTSPVRGRPGRRRRPAARPTERRSDLPRSHGGPRRAGRPGRPRRCRGRPP